MTFIKCAYLSFYLLTMSSALFHVYPLNSFRLFLLIRGFIFDI